MAVFEPLLGGRPSPLPVKKFCAHSGFSGQSRPVYFRSRLDLSTVGERSQRGCVCRVGLTDLLHIAAAPMCFNEACQAEVDRTFALAISIPIVVAVVSIAFLARPLPKEMAEKEEVFADPDTGVVFEGPEGVTPERDLQGELVWKAISYTPWPVPKDEEGERIRIDVGPINDREPRSYMFQRRMRQPSKLIQVTLPRPLGIIFEEDKRNKCVVVGDLVEGSPAEQKKKVSQLNQGLRDSAVLEGDVLRAITCTNFVYPTRALFGAVPPERHIVVFGADGQSWPKVVGALRKGDRNDGDVTLVLERRVDDE